MLVEITLTTFIWTHVSPPPPSGSVPNVATSRVTVMCPTCYDFWKKKPHSICWFFFHTNFLLNIIDNRYQIRLTAVVTNQLMVLSQSFILERFLFVLTVTVLVRRGPMMKQQQPVDQRYRLIADSDGWRLERQNPDWFLSSAGSGSPEKTTWRTWSTNGEHSSF